MPDWMACAVTNQKFDEVVVTDGSEKWKVKAGAPLGYMGLNEIPGDKVKLIEKEWFVHIEVLSTDNRMPGFLSNPGNLTAGNPLIRAVKDKTLYVRAANANPPEFTATTARLNSSVLLDRYAATPVKDKDDKEWFKVTESGWLPQQDIEQIAQFDLLRQGFQPLEENSTGAATDSVRESWIPKIFGRIAAAADEASRLNYANVPEYYRNLMATMDADHDGKITAEEIRAALTVRDPLVKEVVNKFIVKHHSEWFGGRSTGRWEEFYRQLDPIEKAYCEKWQEKLEWMSQVEPFKEGKPIWHFHPVVILDALQTMKCDCEELYACEFKVTRYGSVYGPIYKGKINLGEYRCWDVLIAKGEITSDEKEILIAMSENEGNMDAIQSYDSEVVTVGAMQKTVKDEVDMEGKGELTIQLAKFRDMHPYLYKFHMLDCGWSVEGSGLEATIYYEDKLLTGGEKLTSTELKNIIRQNCNAKAYGSIIKNKPLAALLKVILLPEYLDLQVRDFIERLHEAENTSVTTTTKIKDYIKSQFGRAVVLDHHINRPGFVKKDFKDAVDSFFAKNPKVNANPELWGNDFDIYESKILEEYKSFRRMTDSITRYNSLKRKL